MEWELRRKRRKRDSGRVKRGRGRMCVRDRRRRGLLRETNRDGRVYEKERERGRGMERESEVGEKRRRE